MTFDLSSGLGVKPDVRIIRDYFPSKGGSRLVAVLTNRSSHEGLPQLFLDKNSLETLARDCTGLRGYRDDILGKTLDIISQDSPLLALAHFMNSAANDRISLVPGTIERSLVHLKRQVTTLKRSQPISATKCEQ